MPTPLIPDGIVRPATRTAVESVYLRFLTRDLRALRLRIDKTGPPLRMHLLNAFGDLEARSAYTVVQRTPTELLGPYLNGIIQDIVLVKAKLGNAAAPAYLSPTPVTGEQLLTSDQFVTIQIMIKTIELLAGEVGTGRWDATIKALFGADNVKEAKDNFQQISKLLTVIAEHTTTTEPPPELTRWEEIQAGARAYFSHSRGFVVNAGLSKAMPFLASGSGPTAHIFVRPQSFTEGNASPENISKLVHEGSHVVDSEIIDWLYRTNNDHLSLPTSFRTKNAAHYEALALEMLQPPTGDAVEPRNDLVGRAAALLKFKITRAWVRSNDLLSADVAGGREQVGELLGAVPATIGPAAAQELFSDLYTNSENLMDAFVQGNVKLEGPPPYKLVFPSGNTEVLTFGEGTPSGLARVAIAAMVQLFSRRGAAASPVGLIQFIDRIVEYDRTWIRTKVQELCQFLDAGPVR